MRKIAITGALGAGKSTVCQILKEQGAYVVDADQIAHQLLQGPCKEAVLQLFGSIDRQEVAKKVFNNKDNLKALEKILHPHIIKTIQDTYEIEKTKPHAYFVAEIPLLFETGWDVFFDTTICVTAPIDRLQAHPQWDRMQHQFSQDKKAKQADYIIENDGDLQTLKTKTLLLLGA